MTSSAFLSPTLKLVTFTGSRTESAFCRRAQSQRIEALTEGLALLRNISKESAEAKTSKLCFFCPQVLLMAMKDMNIAKLSSADLPLFSGIIQDLFPAVETPVIDNQKVS